MKTQSFVLASAAALLAGSAGAATNYFTLNSALTGADSCRVFTVDKIVATTLPQMETVVILGLGLVVLVLASRRRRWK